MSATASPAAPTGELRGLAARGTMAAGGSGKVMRHRLAEILD